jgi:serine/threonine-protein kinase HipA
LDRQVQVCVYIDHPDSPVLVGRLLSRVRKGRETVTFEYDPGWLSRPDRFALEPALMLAPGPFHAGSDKVQFGSIGDSAPDRWGRALMRRAERRAAERAGRAPRTLWEIDYLMMVDDEVRPGALRFSETEGGPFLGSAGAELRIPLVISLSRLLSATERVIAEEDDDDDLRLLMAPGSSLGGARPKASIVDLDGHLAIAKFPHQLDDTNVVSWEAVAMSLAGAAGIDIPDWRMAPIFNKAAFIMRRFDRRGGKRVPFLSAMSMLSARENDDGHTYLEIVEALRRHGGAPSKDLPQLWRRIVFNVLISNTDDHLRNHGFLYENPAGWRLSPAYDLNPVPIDVRPRVLATPIDPMDSRASLDLAMGSAEYFGLHVNDARAIVAEVGKAVTSWRSVAEKLGIGFTEIDRMASAFEHEDLRSAVAS